MRPDLKAVTEDQPWHGRRMWNQAQIGALGRLRMVWNVSDPVVASWKKEIPVADGPWTLVEEYEMRPS